MTPAETCPRCEDFADDARKVLNERCAPDERHCSCVPHLRAEVARLTAALAEAQRERLEVGLRAGFDVAELEVERDALRLALDQQNAENLIALDAVTKERDEARATAEERRLSLLAECLDPAGGADLGFTPIMGKWYRPDGERDALGLWPRWWLVYRDSTTSNVTLELRDYGRYVRAVSHTTQRGAMRAALGANATATHP